jgi:N-acetyltransferase
MNPYPITLTGRDVRLEPLAEFHIPGLAKAGAHEIIWQYMRYGFVDNEAKMGDLVYYLLRQQVKGSDLPFTVLHSASEQAIGMTRYMDIQPENRALEIGGTWYNPAFQRTGVTW